MPEAKLEAAEIAAVRDLAVKAAGNLRSGTIAAPVGAVGVPAELPILIRDGASPEAISLRDLFEKYRSAPERRRGVAAVTTLASFVDLVQRHKDEGSAIFAQTAWPEPKLTAVIDYHTIAHEARFGAHRIEYAFPLTEEFKVWIKGDGKPMEQADFAAFLEDHAAELAAPFDAERTDYEPLFKERFATPAELISLSRSLEVFVGAKVKRAERLQTGERTVEFVEQHTNGAGEKVDIPGVFMVAVPAFIDGEKLRIPARLRYRIAGGSIVWFYQLYRWEFWLRAQVQNDLASAARDTALPAFEGAPEK
jgi:uncharacterized protein YfdQ (DUF2303 family)